MVLPICFAFVVCSSVAQEQTNAPRDEYAQVLTKRADKIVNTLDIRDEKKYLRVRDIIVNQYRALNAIHDTCQARVSATKRLTSLSAEEAKQREAGIMQNADTELATLHKEYLRKLSNGLSENEIEKIKDGMTYGVVPLTYKGYLDMIPDLTEDQKKQIMAYLVEARERAMDAGSSEAKHAWFGKYKGRINNYLSDAGYDLRKAGEDWKKRREAGKSK